MLKPCAAVQIRINRQDRKRRAIRQLVPVQQVLFASDFPYRTSADNVQGLVAYGFSQADLETIWRGNAQKLIPRLRA